MEAARRREKKESREQGEEEEEEERKGRLVSIREGEKGGTSGRRGGAGGGGKARTPTRATFSRSFLRSFVRFFVMTVDETMTYFSGFSLPECPAALPFTPSLIPPPSLSPGTRETRACTLWASFHRSPSSLARFLSICRALFSAHPSRLTLSSRVIYVQTSSRLLRNNARFNISFQTSGTMI